MKHALSALLLLVFAHAGALAQTAGDTIRSVIGGQLEAFEADDFVTAFGFASPTIQGMFGTPERFGEMVRNGYPMVWRPGEVTFSDRREVGGRTYQTVLISDREGRLHMLEYEMVEGGDGWKINGVRFLRPPSLGA